MRRLSQLTGCLVITLAAAVQAASPPQPTTPAASPDSAELYEVGRVAVQAKDFSKAVELFTQAHQLDPKNPDILNQLAYSQRHSGKLDQAIENYKLALKLKPNFAEAREYLGEAYLQAALRELATLKTYGEAATEEHEELQAALKEAAAGLKP